MQVRPETSKALLKGQSLFNAHRFWDAHAAWKEAWCVEYGSMRVLLQGLIQVAGACHLAFVTGRAVGTRKLLALGLEKLDDVPDGLAGVALGRFRPAVGLMLNEARLWERGEIPALHTSVVPRLEC